MLILTVSGSMVKKNTFLERPAQEYLIQEYWPWMFIVLLGGVAMIKDLLLRWPVIQQIRNRSDGTGSDVMTERTRQLQPRMLDAQVTRSVCPYCAVGCGQLVYHKNGKLISIEGDPDSPISRGR